MAKDKQGFIKLNRGFFDNFLWNEARTYSKAEAWLDLIQMARFEASVEIIGGKVIELQRGEIPASRRYLELRWNWGSTKVSNFLKMLTDFKMIKQSLKSGQTTILLLNFGTYNDTQTTNKPVANQRQTSSEPEANQNKELQEGKESKEDVSTSPPKSFKKFSKADFKDSIGIHAEGYTKDLLNKFYLYWTEPSASGQMRFQLEKTWETGRRLSNWKSREKQDVVIETNQPKRRKL